MKVTSIECCEFAAILLENREKTNRDKNETVNVSRKTKLNVKGIGRVFNVSEKLIEMIIYQQKV